MNSSSRAWYTLAAVLALAPIGIRVATWKTPRPASAEAAAVHEGSTLFMHQWTPRDPLANGGDGLGPVFNARSCGACHNQGGVGGSGGVEHNVTTFIVESQDGQPAREGVVHASGVGMQETLQMVDPRLPAVFQPRLDFLVRLPSSNHCLTFPRGIHLSQRNTPALFGANLIDAIPDRVIITGERSQQLQHGMASPDQEQVAVGRALRLPCGRIGKFGWKAQSPSLAEFVQAACANELGLGNPEHPQPKPLGKLNYEPPGLDLTLEQCNQLTAFVAALPRPAPKKPGDERERQQARAGEVLFTRIGCADCHTPNLGDVDGLYSDLLLHPMGEVLIGGGSYNEPPLDLPRFKPGEGPVASEWRTPPLWGVADSAPYLHDGRARTLQEAIQLHGGQGARAARLFSQLSPVEQKQVISLLQTLRAPQPEQVARR